MAGSGGYTIQLDETEYRIVGPAGEEGPIVPYGDTATLCVDGGATYYCHITEEQAVDIASVVPEPRVLRVDNVSEMPTELLEVEFPDDELDDDLEDEDDEEELDPEELDPEELDPEDDGNEPPDDDNEIPGELEVTELDRNR